MKGKAGGQTSMHRVVRPAFGSLPVPPNLSREARLRLKWMDYYHRHRDASLTCRHFGIGRSLFYKWKKRYNRMGPRGLEATSKRPQAVRAPMTPTAHVDLIRALRRTHPEYSKYKLAVILARDHGITLSASTVGRVITRYNLFFARPVKPKGHPFRRLNRRRLPKELVGVAPGELVEVDVKHLPLADKTRYAFVTIDRATRRTSIHVANTISSTQGAAAWRKAVTDLGLTRPAVLTDNGSENLGAFTKLLEEQDVPHYFARPRTPKDKPYVERVIGTLERECIQWGGIGFDVPEQQAVIDDWLKKYHSYRPHQALGYLTPDEYAARLVGKVSTML